jgi:Zn finger protein HypA/HybF involved in hydrogenase expression
MKALQLTALDGSKWNIPATVIADSYKAHYGPDEEPDDGDLIEWAGNDMNWSDVREHAVQVKGADACDMQDSWLEGDFEIADAPDMAAQAAAVVEVSKQAFACTRCGQACVAGETLDCTRGPCPMEPVGGDAQPFSHVRLTQDQIDALALTVKVGEVMSQQDYRDLFYAMRDDAATILAGVEPGDHGDAIIAAFGERAARVAIFKAAGLSE